MTVGVVFLNLRSPTAQTAKVRYRLTQLRISLSLYNHPETPTSWGRVHQADTHLVVITHTSRRAALGRIG